MNFSNRKGLYRGFLFQTTNLSKEEVYGGEG